jgi:hypothetical protein
MTAPDAGYEKGRNVASADAADVSAPSLPASGEIAIWDGFLEERECQFVLWELEFAHWRPSYLIHVNDAGEQQRFLSQRRVSMTAQQAWFPEALNSFMAKIESRLQALIPLNRSTLESWQATRYPHGGRLGPHLDAGYWHGHPAGERELTMLIYLTTPISGGGTEFRALGRCVEAVAGRLICWRNLLDSGGADHRMVHAGLPLLGGDKVTLVTWTRQRHYRNQASEELP